MCAHSRGFDHAAQGFLAPSPARLVGTQDPAELESLVRQRKALVSECFQVLGDFPDSRGVSCFALLQAGLIILELLLERLDQGGDGLLALREVAFGGFLKLGESLVGQPEKIRLGLFERVDAERLERLAQIGERLVL